MQLAAKLRKRSSVTPLPTPLRCAYGVLGRFLHSCSNLVVLAMLCAPSLAWGNEEEDGIDDHGSPSLRLHFESGMVLSTFKGY